MDELVEALHLFSTQVDQRFDRIESTMATKSYVDYKLADLRGDMLLSFKQTDSKINTVAEILEQKQVFSRNESAEVQALGPLHT